MKRVLITGGAGFIGSHLARELLGHGYDVRALDSLIPQVHGAERKRPAYLPPEVELQVGDVRDPDAVRRALDGVDGVFHLAALVGVGQSMYRMADYTGANGLGTAVLLEALAERPVERLVFASSMNVYGEGCYRDGLGRLIGTAERTPRQLAAGHWEPRGPAGELLTPVPTTEDKPPVLSSVYALSKYHQERLCLLARRTSATPTVALRLFNVYGPHQALSNPYTGVLAIFATRLLNGQPPLVFEDGRQQRDFVNVRDVARAFRLAFETRAADGQVLNIASGAAHSVLDIAQHLSAAIGQREIEPQLTGKFRVGDIRHCFADVSAARAVLDYRPLGTLAAGLAELLSWLEGEVATALALALARVSPAASSL